MRRVDGSGVITTFAGTGESGTPVDGSLATQASFPELYGLAFEPAGTLLVADGQRSMYRIGLDLRISRIAGAS